MPSWATTPAGAHGLWWLSTGDFRAALPVLLGEQAAAGLSRTTITRLTAAWQAEYQSFCETSLAERDYVYLWADGTRR